MSSLAREWAQRGAHGMVESAAERDKGMTVEPLLRSGPSRERKRPSVCGQRPLPLASPVKDGSVRLPSPRPDLVSAFAVDNRHGPDAASAPTGTPRTCARGPPGGGFGRRPFPQAKPQIALGFSFGSGGSPWLRGEDVTAAAGSNRMGAQACARTGAETVTSRWKTGDAGADCAAGSAGYSFSTGSG